MGQDMCADVWTLTEGPDFENAFSENVRHSCGFLMNSDETHKNIVEKRIATIRKLWWKQAVEFVDPTFSFIHFLTRRRK